MPEIRVIRNDVKHVVSLLVVGNDFKENKEISFEDFHTCMSQLNINNVQDLRNRFVDFCDWFLKKEKIEQQYVPFEEIKTHRINIKGNYSKAFLDSQTGKNYQDITYGYGCIMFTGTEKELDDYLGYLVENEGKFGFKII